MDCLLLISSAGGLHDDHFPAVVMVQAFVRDGQHSAQGLLSTLTRDRGDRVTIPRRISNRWGDLNTTRTPK